MAITHSFADIAQYYYSTAVELLHCSVTDTPVIHHSIQPDQKRPLFDLATTSSSSYYTAAMTFIVGQLIGNSVRISLPVIRIRIGIFHQLIN